MEKSYLEICERAAASGDVFARQAFVGLSEVIFNNRPKFTLVYPCHSPNQKRWFRMWIEPQSPAMAAVIIAHKLLEEVPSAAETIEAGKCSLRLDH